MTVPQLLMTVALVALTTALTRFTFWLFPAGRQAPAFVVWLERRLPRAVMVMLVVYCLKDISLSESPFGLPALMGVAVTAGLHLWRRRMMLSIAGGTAVYMVLLRLMA